MPKRATILNLLPESDTDEKSLCERLDVDECVLVKGADVRERGMRGGLNYLRKIHGDFSSDTIAVHLFDWSRQTQRTGLYGLLCLVSAKKRLAIEPSGAIYPLTWPGLIFNEIPSAIQQILIGGTLRAKAESLALDALRKFEKKSSWEFQKIGRIAYMRTDLWYGVKAGGSIGHVAGVIDGFGRSGIGVHVLSWDRPPLVPENVEFTRIQSTGFFRNERELELLSYNDRLINIGFKSLMKNAPDAIYARYSLNCYAPAVMASNFKVPLIVEYNGSEVWIEEHWGRGLKYPEVSSAIENWILTAADLITVVSAALRDELVRRGYSEKKILVNPNAVDPERFDPSKYTLEDISKLKRELGIPEAAIVAGFIGTFSPWHGVEVLADSIPKALKKCPNLHFLLIGSGPSIDRVKSSLENAGALEHTTLTGIVPQAEAPKYLKCADFYLSPHVPNPDGTRFFGSPTKLFEYMALGKGIIASDLDQLGEILVHEKTALLVKPGDVDSLVEAIARLYSDRELSKRLGDAAREDALKNHAWEAHVGKILTAMHGLSHP